MRVPSGKSIESVTLAFANGDLIVYDLASGAVHSAYVGAQILRSVQGRPRHNTISGTVVGEYAFETPIRLIADSKSENPKALHFLGYDRAESGVRLRRRVEFAATEIEAAGARATEYLCLVSARLREQDVTVEIVVRRGRAGDQILSATKRGDLVIIAARSHEQTGAGLGSVTYTVAGGGESSGARCPGASVAQGRTLSVLDPAAYGAVVSDSFAVSGLT